MTRTYCFTALVVAAIGCDPPCLHVYNLAHRQTLEQSRVLCREMRVGFRACWYSRQAIRQR